MIFLEFLTRETYPKHNLIIFMIENPLLIFSILNDRFLKPCVQVESWTFAYMRQVNKHYENKVFLRWQNLFQNYYQPLELLVYS